MSPALGIKLNGDGAWPDLAGRMGDVIHVGNDGTFEMSGLRNGMSSGAPSVCFRLDLPDGKVVLAETSWRLFELAYKAFLGKFGPADFSDGDAALELDLGGGGKTRLQMLPENVPGFTECELCGERREASADPEDHLKAVQWLYRHFREKHPDWTPPVEEGAQ